MNIDVNLPWFLLAFTLVVSIIVVGSQTITNRRLLRGGIVGHDNTIYPWIDGIDEFVDLIVASRLVDERRMQQFLSEFHKSTHELSQFGDTITAFSAFLVSHDVLTCWQIAKLRQGQYKGFYEVPGYRLLDRLGNTGTSAAFIAEDAASGEVVALDISPGSGAGKLLHRVAQVLGHRSRPSGTTTI